MTENRISIDWSRLLGFDQCAAPSIDRMGVPAAKVGSKDPPIRDESGPFAANLNAKVGATQMLRRAGGPDSVALARLTKVGLKGT